MFNIVCLFELEMLTFRVVVRKKSHALTTTVASFFSAENMHGVSILTVAIIIHFSVHFSWIVFEREYKCLNSGRHSHACCQKISLGLEIICMIGSVLIFKYCRIQ